MTQPCSRRPYNHPHVIRVLFVSNYKTFNDARIPLGLCRQLVDWAQRVRSDSAEGRRSTGAKKYGRTPLRAQGYGPGCKRNLGEGGRAGRQGTDELLAELRW